MLRSKPVLAGIGVLFSMVAVHGAGPGLPLVEAVKRVDRAVVRALVREGVSANAQDADGTTALHWAVHRNDVEIVDVLLAGGANVNAANRYGVIPLSLASTNGNTAILERLLKAGADANAALPGGEAALMTAARTGNAEAIKVLLAHGARPDAPDAAGQTPLMWAASRDNAVAIRTLVEAGASLKATTHGGAGESARGAFMAPTPTGFSALMFAVRAGGRTAVTTLLDLGANVNDTVSDGTSALVVAVANGHFDLAAYLLDRGADPNASAQGWTALHHVTRIRRPNIGFGTPGAIPTGTMDGLEFAKRLIARGVNVNARMTRHGMLDGQRNRFNRLGSTAFLLAAKSNDVDFMRLLLEAGADPKIPNADGTTPLMVAAGVAIWNPGEDGGSLVGSEAEVLEAVKICIEGGNDVDAENYRHETAMHGAAFRGDNAVMELLASKGARVDVRAEPYGWSPLTIASGVFYSDFFKEQKHTAALLRTLYAGRGISTEGHQAKPTECLDCLQTRKDQTTAWIENIKKMEAAYAAAPQPSR